MSAEGGIQYRGVRRENAKADTWKASRSEMDKLDEEDFFKKRE